MVHTFASVILQVNGECWANMIVVTKAGEVLVTKLAQSRSELITCTISKKKSSSNNKRKHRVEFLYMMYYYRLLHCKEQMA